MLTKTEINQIIQQALSQGHHPRLEEALTAKGMSLEEFYFWLNTLNKVTRHRDRRLILIATGNSR